MKPEGVRIVCADGSELECELVHEGVDANGIDQWLIANAVLRIDQGDTVRIRMFPGRTGIGFDTSTCTVTT